MKLGKILETEENILVDGSVHGDSIDITEYMYDATNYSQLNVNKLNLALRDLENFKELIKPPQIHTIRALTKEFRGIEEIFSQKIRNSNAFGRRVLKRFRINYEQRNNKQKQKLLELQETTYKIRRISEIKELDNLMDDAKYIPLLNFIKSISSSAKLKIDNSYLIGHHKSDQSLDSDTDERLVATLFYFSLYSNKSFSLLAQDRDFIRLIRTPLELLTCDKFSHNNQDIKRRLNENPFRFYLKGIRDEDYSFIVDTKKIEPTPTFSHKNLGKSQVGTLLKITYNGLKNLSKDYSSLPKSPNTPQLQTLQL